MNYFVQIDNAQAILRYRGVYRQVDLYAHNQQVFAKWGSGFVRLLTYQQGTTKPAVQWVELMNDNAEVRLIHEATGVRLLNA